MEEQINGRILCRAEIVRGSVTDFACAKAHPETLQGCFCRNPRLSNLNTQQTMCWKDKGEWNCIKHANQLLQIISTLQLAWKCCYPACLKHKVFQRPEIKIKTKMNSENSLHQARAQTSHLQHSSCSNRQNSCTFKLHRGLVLYFSLL